MGFFHDVFSRSGRVARVQINKGMDQIEDATFESTVKQTVADMRTELSKTIGAAFQLRIRIDTSGSSTPHHCAAFPSAAFRSTR